MADGAGDSGGPWHVLIAERIARLEGHVLSLRDAKESAHVEIVKDVDALDRREERHHEDHEVRIRAIERTMWRAVGAAAAASTLISVLANYIIRTQLG